MEEEDSVIAEVPVYLAKSLNNQLQIFQFPVRPHSHTYDDATILKAQIRPRGCQVEIEMGIKTRTATYDRCKGEQIALNVDGAYRNKKAEEDNFYKTNVMDKLVFTSSKSVSDVRRYAIGVVGDGGLHLTPVSCVLALKPSCTHLDLADKRIRKDSKDAENDASGDSDDENMKKVTVRFERPDTEWSKNARERSYGFLQRKMREEPWINVQYNKFGSEESEFESRRLYCMYEKEQSDTFGLASIEYLNQIIPTTEQPEISPYIQTHQLSRSALAQLSLHDHIKVVMLKAGVASFGELVSALHKGVGSEISVLKVLQQVAVLVQGNWVVKSDLLYPKTTEPSSTGATKIRFTDSGVPHDALQRGRDYALYLFSKDARVTRSKVADIVDLPGSDIIEVFKGISRSGTPRGCWQFLLPTDNEFINKNPEVVQRQQMIWQSRHEQLSHTFKDQIT